MQAAHKTRPRGGVDVIAEETVGPYETVTVASDDPEALHTWLTTNGYAVPAATLPTIAYYVDKGSAFVVMRLAPDADVAAMTPIRVRYAGHMASFPLRMVTVGASGLLDLSLWVIAEQRYEALNYQNGTIEADDVTWNWATLTSDYPDAFRRRIDELGGAAWITEWAQPLSYVPTTAADDLAVASHGLVAPFLTRLRTSVLVDNLAGDLELGPALDSSWRDGQLLLLNSVGDPPVPQCPGGGPGGSDGGAGGADDDGDSRFPTGCAVSAGAGAWGGGLGALLLGALTMGLHARRRRRSR